MKQPALEFCITDLTGAQAAQAGGADRVELCIDLSVGGLTPSAGLIGAAAQCLETHVLLRPRAGNFVYSTEEQALTLAEIAVATQMNATGVVFGGLTETGQIDIDFTRQLVKTTLDHQLQPTFHRAFDFATGELLDDLEQLIDLGVARILTTGRAVRAADGIANLERLVQAASGRIQIMAGGGVNPKNAARLLATGVDALHCSIHLGTAEENPDQSGPMGRVKRYDSEKITGMRAAVDRFTSR